MTRKETETLATMLRKKGFQADHYHADLSPEERHRVHTAWLANGVRIVVATNAFGLGINKPDVRFVLHHSIAKAMEVRCAAILLLLQQLTTYSMRPSGMVLRDRATIRSRVAPGAMERRHTACCGIGHKT